MARSDTVDGAHPVASFGITCVHDGDPRQGCGWIELRNGEAPAGYIHPNYSLPPARVSGRSPNCLVMIAEKAQADLLVGLLRSERNGRIGRTGQGRLGCTALLNTNFIAGTADREQTLGRVRERLAVSVQPLSNLQS